MSQSLIQSRVEAEADSHIHIYIDAPEKPGVDIDISNRYGRRFLHVRSDGMTIGSLLLDVADMKPVSHRIERFCPYCGEEQSLISSVDRHAC